MGILGIFPAATAEFNALTHATGIVLGSGSVSPGGGKLADHSAEKGEYFFLGLVHAKLTYQGNQLARRFRRHHLWCA
jgi:hypothetical protein